MDLFKNLKQDAMQAMIKNELRKQGITKLLVSLEGENLALEKIENSRPMVLIEVSELERLQKIKELYLKSLTNNI